MQAILREINGVIGVTGSFYCSTDGSVVEHALPEQFDAARVALAGRVVNQTFLALETSGQRVTEADLQFSHSRLILKNLRSGVLAILCAPTISIPLLNLNANLAVKKIAAELKQSRASAPGLDAAPPPVPAPAASMPQPQPAQPAARPLPQIEPEKRQIDEERAPTSVVPTLEIVDSRFFDQLIRELARVIGPAASLIIEEEISALKETQATFPKARAAELVERVSLGIRDETKRVKFQQAMLAVIRKL
jgi:predicted regulator of Ras-like GTPase activity (Roadblock/LC7/MglB family)